VETSSSLKKAVCMGGRPLASGAVLLIPRVLFRGGRVVEAHCWRAAGIGLEGGVPDGVGEGKTDYAVYRKGRRKSTIKKERESPAEKSRVENGCSDAEGSGRRSYMPRIWKGGEDEGQNCLARRGEESGRRSPWSKREAECPSSIARPLRKRLAGWGEKSIELGLQKKGAKKGRGQTEERWRVGGIQ